MNQTQKLLQSIVENSRTGADACEQLLNRTDDLAMRKELMLEKQQYSQAAWDAEKHLYHLGLRPEPKSPMARASMWMGMQMNTMLDKTPSHIADITIQGATMGVVEITKARNANPDADPKAHDIASALITHQQEAIERLKAFLKEKVVVQ